LSLMKTLDSSEFLEDANYISLLFIFLLWSSQLLDHVIRSFIDQHILPHWNLKLLAPPVPFVYNSNLEDAVDIDVHTYFALRTIMVCRGMLSRMQSSAILFQVSTSGYSPKLLPKWWKSVSGGGNDGIIYDQKDWCDILFAVSIVRE
jgi:hypothetical protein